jgi:hypothetical protein
MKKELGLNEETDKKIVQIHLFRKYQLKKIENSSEASDYAGQYVVFSTDYLEDDETIPRLGLKWGRFGFVTKNPAITGNLDKNGHHLRVISLKNLEAKHMICNNNYLKSHELFMRLATPEELDIIEAKKTDIQFKFGILIKN